MALTFRNCPSDVRNDRDEAIRVDYQDEGEPWTWTLLFPGEKLPGLSGGRTRTIVVEAL